MHVVAWRDGVDPTEAWVRQSAGKHHMTVDPVLARRDLSKGDAHLKSDTGLFWQDANRANHAKRGNDFVEERSNLWWLANKMVFEIVSPTSVGLVAIRKPSSALCALP